MNLQGKNLFDVNKQIEESINLISKSNETIISTEINNFTLEYLKKLGIYGIANKPMIINDNLLNFQIKLNRQKNIMPTEYMPYKKEE